MKKLLLSILLCFAFGLSQAQITSFPYQEDFEAYANCTGSCNSPCATFGAPATLGQTWFNENTGADGGEWIVDENGTSSSSTGPSIDYNPGTSTGNYVYYESSSPCYSNVTAYLYSPDIDMNAVSGLNLVFAYHMYGSSTGTLAIEASTDGGATWSPSIWSMSGDQGDVWNTDTVSLTPFVGNTVRLRFRGLTTTSFTSDMALDDIILYEPLPVDAGVTAFPSPGLPSCNLTGSAVEATITNF